MAQAAGITVESLSDMVDRLVQVRWGAVWRERMLCSVLWCVHWCGVACSELG